MTVIVKTRLKSYYLTRTFEMNFLSFQRQPNNNSIVIYDTH